MSKQKAFSGEQSLNAGPIKPLVLVAEDHEDTRELLNIVLARQGLDVVEALNGADAVDVAERVHPDAILMDTLLPGLDGIAATRRMRELELLREVPIIFLSGRAEPAVIAEAWAACDDYLVKPIDLDQLNQVLAHCIAEKYDARHGLRSKGQLTMSCVDGSGDLPKARIDR